MSQDDRPDRSFTLDDFRKQVVLMKKIGVFSDLDAQLFPEEDSSDLSSDGGEAEFRRMMAILDAMTPAERLEPSLIDAEAHLRIAAEAGAEPEDVSKLLDEFETMSRMVDTMNRLRFWERVRKIMGLDDASDAGGARSRGRRRRERDRRRRREEAAVRSLCVDGPRLDSGDRQEMLRRWDVLARSGRAPRDSSPWFAAWNRNLRLWDFTLDD